MPRAAWLYLLHAALVTGSLAITSLLWNLAVLALGFPRSFLGTLGVVGIATAGLFALPLWWLVGRIGLPRALVLSAALQACGALLVALRPEAAALLVTAGVTGAAAVLFQISATPYMMQHSDDTTRDHLFSANAAVNVGVAGAGSLLAGQLPALGGGDAAAGYRAAFAVAGAGLLLAIVPLLVGRGGDTEREGEGGRMSMSPPLPFARSNHTPRMLNELLHRAGWLVPLLIPPALISIGAALLIPYLNLFFHEQFRLSDTALGSLFAALGLATGVASLAAPLLSARIGKAGAIMLVQGLSIPFLLAVGFAGAIEIAVVTAIVRGALFNMSAPLYDALAMERSAVGARPAVIGLVNAAYAGGYLVAPPLSVAVQEQWGFGPLFGATAICYGLAVLAVFWFFGRGRAKLEVA